MEAEFESLELDDQSFLSERTERERIHFNKIAIRYLPPHLVMSRDNVDRYRNPPADTPFPLEYAFHLLGDLEGKTIVDLGCGEGLNTVILAALGSKVIAVDISDNRLKTTNDRVQANRLQKNVLVVHGDATAIPIEDSRVHGVLCSSMLRHTDWIAAARQIRRILKPGGSAVFVEQVSGPIWLNKLRRLVPRPDHVSEDERPLNLRQVISISRAVGRPGRSREFMLMSRILDRIGIRHFPTVRKSHRIDSWILDRFGFARSLASPLVWEALKEQ